MKRLAYTRHAVKTKRVDGLDAEQIAFGAASASKIKATLHHFRSTHPNEPEFPYLKFITQLENIFVATDPLAALSLIKTSLSLRPNSNLPVPSHDEQHPLQVIIHLICEWFFKYSNRACIKETIKLISMMIGTNISGSESIVSTTTITHFNSCLETFVDNLSKHALLDTIYDNSTDKGQKELLAEVKQVINSCDVLWALISSPIQSQLGIWSNTKYSVPILSFLSRAIRTVSQDQHRFDALDQFYPASTTESILVSTYGILKIITLYSSIRTDLGLLVKNLGLKSVLEILNHPKLEQSLASSFSQYLHLHLSTAILYGTIRLLQSQFCSRDHVHTAGLIAAHISVQILTATSQQVNDGQLLQQQLLMTFLPQYASSPVTEEALILNAFFDRQSDSQLIATNLSPLHLTFNQKLFDNLPSLQHISILRGLLLSFADSPQLILGPCSNLILPSVSPAAPSLLVPSAGSFPSNNENFKDGSLFFDALVPALIKASESSCERQTRLLAVNGIGEAAHILVQHMNSSKHSESSSQSFLKYKVSAFMDKLLEVIWKNWEDPYESIVSEIWNIFPKLLDLAQQNLVTFGPSTAANANFMDKLTSHLLDLDVGTKGKYPLLVMLMQRVGPQKFLELKPSFVGDIFVASSIQHSGKAVSALIDSFLHALDGLRQLQLAPNNSSTPIKAKGNKGCRSKTELEMMQHVQKQPSVMDFTDPLRFILDPLLSGLKQEDTLTSLSGYALPIMFDLFPESLPVILSRLFGISDVNSPDSSHANSIDFTTMRALLAVLKVARGSAKISAETLLPPNTLASVTPVKGSKVKPSTVNSITIPPNVQVMIPQLIAQGLQCHDVRTRLDAMLLVMETKVGSDLPTGLELEALLLNLDKNLVEKSMVYRNRAHACIDSLLVRLKESIRHHYKLPCRNIISQIESSKDMKRIVEFMDEFSNTLIYNIYTPSPPHRRFTSLEFIHSVATRYGPNPQKGSSFVPFLDLATIDDVENVKDQYVPSTTSNSWKSLEIFSKAATLSILVGLWDMYDAGRILCFEVLKSFPSPLPGLEAPDLVNRFARWAIASVCSPRMREADSGSLALRLMATKYIWVSGWTIRVEMKPASPHNNAPDFEIVVSATPPTSPEGNAEFKETRHQRLSQFCHDLIDIVLLHAKHTKSDRGFAAMHLPIHGPLMALRYVISDVPLININPSEVVGWKRLLKRVVTTCESVSALCLELKYPLRYTHNQYGAVDNTGVDAGDDNDEGYEAGESSIPASETNKNVTGNDRKGGTTESILVSAWLSLKAVAFLLGSLVKTVVAIAIIESRSNPHAAEGQYIQASTQASVPAKSQDLPLNLMKPMRIQKIGQLLLDNMLVLRHRGAMETSAEGFQVICEALIQSNDRTLQSFVHEWLDQLFNKIDHSPWALLSTRRSAGLPYAFLAILRAEASGGERERISHKLLPRTIEHLNSTASRIGADMVHQEGEYAVAHKEKNSLQDSSNSKSDADVGKGTESNHAPKEYRHQVHALNVIRAIIRDKTIIHDISPYMESILILVLRLYLSPHWAVQNSATMTFSTLLERITGGSRQANTTIASNPQPQTAASSNTSSSISSANSLSAFAPRTPPTAMTAISFFTKFPAAHSFLISILADSSLASSTSASGSSFSNSPLVDPFVDRVFAGVRSRGLFPSSQEWTQMVEKMSSFPSRSSNTSSSASSSFERNSNDGVASTSLYAVLLLLSRMSPSKVLSIQQQFNIAPFVFLIVSSAMSVSGRLSADNGGHNHGMIRILASKAVAPLISTPTFPYFLQSMIDAIPNSLEELQKFELSHGVSNLLHGLLILIHQLLSTHWSTLCTATSTSSDSETGNEEEAYENSNKGKHIEQLELPKFVCATVFPSLFNKLWILRCNVPPISSVLLSIILDFIVIPCTEQPSLLDEYPGLQKLLFATCSLSSLHLQRISKGLDIPSQRLSDTEKQVQRVVSQTMLHKQLEIESQILFRCLHHFNQIACKIPQFNRIFFFASEHTTGSSVQITINGLVSHPEYEVRLTTLKMLHKLARTATIHPSASSKTFNDIGSISWNTIADHLMQLAGFTEAENSSSKRQVQPETHPKCLLKIVRLLNLLGNKGFLQHVIADISGTHTQRIWTIIKRWAYFGLNETMVRHSPQENTPLTLNNKIQQTLSGVSTSLRHQSLIFAAFFLHRALAVQLPNSIQSEQYLEMVRWWICMIDRHSRYELAVDDRLAAASSVSQFVLAFDKFKFLDHNSELKRCAEDICIDFWMLVLRMMQDEEEQVRDDARMVVSGIWKLQPDLQSGKSQIVDIEQSLSTLTSFLYEYVSSQCPSHPRYLQWLLHGLCTDIPASLTQASAISQTAAQLTSSTAYTIHNKACIFKLGMPTELFEQEKPNFFAEPALISQLCYYQLVNLRSHMSINNPDSKDIHLKERKEILDAWPKALLAHFEIVVNALSLHRPLTHGEKEESTAQPTKLSRMDSATMDWHSAYDYVFTPLYSTLISFISLLHSKLWGSISAVDENRLIDRLQHLHQEKCGVLHPILASLVNTLQSQLGNTATLSHVDAKSSVPSAAQGGVSQTIRPRPPEVTFPPAAASWDLVNLSHRHALNFLLPRAYNYLK